MKRLVNEEPKHLAMTEALRSLRAEIDAEPIEAPYDAETAGRQASERTIRLNAAAKVASSLRAGTLVRKINVVKKDGSIEQKTHAEVVDALRLKELIEFDVDPPDPKGQKKCAGTHEKTCQKHVPAYAFGPAHVKKRHGQPWRCASCAQTVKRDQNVCMSCGGKVSTNKCKECMNCYKKKLSAKKKAVASCAICGKPATEASSAHARQKRGFAFCMDHKGMRNDSCTAKYERGDQKTCAGYDGFICSKPVTGPWAFLPNIIRRRGGGPWRCNSCAKVLAWHRKRNR